MSITLQSGTPAALDEIVEAVALWQEEGAPVQLHPGDLGWAWRFGAQALAGGSACGAVTGRSWPPAWRTARMG